MSLIPVAEPWLSLTLLLDSDYSDYWFLILASHLTLLLPMPCYLAARLLPNLAILVTLLLSPAWLIAVSECLCWLSILSAFLGPAPYQMPCLHLQACNSTYKFCTKHLQALVLLLTIATICSTFSGAWVGDTREADLVIPGT